MKLSMLRNLAVVGMGTALLAACDHNDNNRNTPEPEPEPVMLTYEVTIENISAAQPLSPVAVLLHGEQSLWQVGESASAALEVLAEGGDNSDVLATEGTLATESGSAPVGPGSNESYQLTVSDEQAAYLSVVTMLVNTNDAFTGITNKALSEMAVNDSMAICCRFMTQVRKLTAKLLAPYRAPLTVVKGLTPSVMTRILLVITRAWCPPRTRYLTRY